MEINKNIKKIIEKKDLNNLDNFEVCKYQASNGDALILGGENNL